MLFGALLLLLAQAKAQDCPFKVQMNVIPATCYNNGMVAYTLVDDAGDPLSAAPNGIGDVRIYYKLSEADSAQYGANWTGDWDTLLVDYGTYIVGVEASCADGHGGFTKVDTHTVLTIPTTYVKPEVSALYVTATRLTDYGKRPTLSCMESGRIQLKIENGRFPYTVTVKRHGSNDIYRTVVFDTNLYSGNVATRYDYKYYYTIDTLPAGDWDCYVVDGCEYGLPRTGQIVEVINFPKLVGIQVYNSSGNFEDSNVVKIQATLDRDYSYYTALLPQYVKYRFTYEGRTPSEDDWRPFPEVITNQNNTGGNNFNVVLYDTATHVTKYCDLWNKTITFEYKITGCGDQTISKSFIYQKPYEGYFVKDFSDHRDSSVTDGDPCTDKWSYHRWYYKIYYYHPNMRGPNSFEDLGDRYHYTHPLTWIYTDTVTGVVIKRDTLDDIRTHSYLYDSDVEAVYGSFHDVPLELHVERKLVDAKGCEVYLTIDPLVFYYETGSQVCDWSISWNGQDHCCDVLREVNVFEHFHSEADPDSTVIRLVRSPYNNRYNFEAIYRSENRKWTVTKENLLNMAEIVGSWSGLSLSIKDYCLPSGPYEFEILTPCDSFYVYAYDTLRSIRGISFPDIYETRNIPNPEFSFYQQCTDRYITYEGPNYARISRNTSPTTGLELPPVETPITTEFQIMRGPVGGYDETRHYGHSSVRVSMPGTFVIRVQPNGSMSLIPYNLCDYEVFYDTIVYEGSTVDFDYALAMLCDSNSTTGSVFVHGSNGTEPYTYTLYDQANKQGNVIATNTTGIFRDVPMELGQRLSCMVKDGCDAFFHVNLMPTTLMDLQKVWFDGGLTATETCEGTYVRVNALEIGSVLEYEWTGPDGFTSTEPTPYVFIPRGATSGWYKVALQNTGCAPAILDSIYLTVQEAPTVTLTPDTTVCPGEAVNVRFIPKSPLATTDSITFTIAFSNGDGVETRTYTALSGEMVTDTYVTHSAATITPIRIDDGRCPYTYSDTSIHINMRTDIADACSILTTYDTVCYGYDGHLTAKSTLAPPYTLRWYGDYELTHLLKEEDVTDADFWSSYDTARLTQRAVLYVSLEKDGACPTVYGVPTHTMMMNEGSTTLACGQTFRFYDSGGADGNYATGEVMLHTFTSADGAPVTVQFDELDLSQTAHLFVISGDQPLMDSLLFDLTYGSQNPGIISSNGNTLTLLFMSGMKAAPGWKALVERAPGIAIAQVRPKNEVIISDNVCQSQTLTYQDPYQMVSNGIVASADTLNKALRKAGQYRFSRDFLLSDVNGCDSMVTFILTVTNPPHYDTTVITTNLHGGSVTWHDSTYTASGRYTYFTALPDGCDSVDILDFIVLQIDTSDNQLCVGDSTVMSISVTVPDLPWEDSVVSVHPAIGDVYCTDGTILSPEEFIHSTKQPMGVIFHLDNTGQHGLMIALVDTGSARSYATNPYWRTNKNVSPTELDAALAPLVRGPYVSAIGDLNGMGNTEEIKRIVELLPGGDFAVNTPAAHYCYYFDHLTGSVGAEHKGWYFPAIGELYMLGLNFDKVEATLQLLQSEHYKANTLLTGNAYNNFIVSSSLMDKDNIWTLNVQYDSTLNSFFTLHYMNINIVRAVHAF